MAAELELDLVCISEKSDPPVCKIVDYGKLRYQMERKKKDNAKKAKVNEVKEVKMSYKIDTHDYQVGPKMTTVSSVGEGFGEEIRPWG